MEKIETDPLTQNIEYKLNMPLKIK